MTYTGEFMYLVPKRSLTDMTIVLDIDETLVHTEEEMETFDAELKSDPILVDDLYDIHLDHGEYKMWGTKRPHLDEFLLFCFSYFKNVCIWSAGKSDYVHAIVKKIFAPFREPDIIYTFDECVQTDEGYWIKPLETFFKDTKVKKLEINRNNTFIVDDRDYTFQKNKINGIQIPEYAPENKDHLQNEDDSLMKLKCWFMKQFMNDKSNVEEINKEGLFEESMKTYYKDIEREIEVL
jgi:TFIIF-interacting CTD phosphatase-like protein